MRLILVYLRLETVQQGGIPYLTEAFVDQQVLVLVVQVVQDTLGLRDRQVLKAKQVPRALLVPRAQLVLKAPQVSPPL
jgi:hypothetical protein